MSVPTPDTPRPSGTTRLTQAIADTRDRKASAQNGTSLVALFWLGVVRNFVLGLPLAGLGFLNVQGTLTQFSAHTAAGGVHLHDLIPFIPGAALLLAGIAFLAPSQVEAVARFLGLGGIIDRLPFVKAKDQP